jgi:DNA-binding NarL/FixJ family response regulator
MLGHPIRVVVVDDDEDVLDLIATMFEVDDRFELVAVATTARSGLDAVRTHVPDVAVVDLELPDESGLVLLDQIRGLALDVRTLVFSAFPDPFTLMDVLRRGADGYLDKAHTWSELLPTILTLFHGTGSTLTA